jgi:hypothetical protein
MTGNHDIAKGADNAAPKKGMQHILAVAFGETGGFGKLGDGQKPVALQEK